MTNFRYDAVWSGWDEDTQCQIDSASYANRKTPLPARFHHLDIGIVHTLLFFPSEFMERQQQKTWFYYLDIALRFPALDGNHDLSIFPMVQHLDPHLIPILHHYKAHRLVRRVVSRCMRRSWGALVRLTIHRSSARDWRDPYWLRLAGSILDGSSSFHAQWLAPVNASSSAFKQRKTTKTKFLRNWNCLVIIQTEASLPTTKM